MVGGADLDSGRVVGALYVALNLHHVLLLIGDRRCIAGYYLNATAAVQRHSICSSCNNNHNTVLSQNATYRVKRQCMIVAKSLPLTLDVE